MTTIFKKIIDKKIEADIIFENDINLKFRSKTGYILDSKPNNIDISLIIKCLKENKSLDNISNKYNIDVISLKKIIQKDLLKEENSDTNTIISKYGFMDDKDKEWIKSIN